MKKKILSFVLAICLIIPALFLVTACNEQPLSKAELSTIYGEVAQGTWAKLGVSDPTVEQVATAIPDFKTETTKQTEIENINMNGNSMAGLLYMLSLLYNNEAFQTTNNIAVFDVTITMGSNPYVQNYTLESSVDKSNNKVYLQAVIVTMGTAQYSNLEVDYNFDTKTVLAYRFCTNVMENCVDMSLTADNKYMYYESAGQSNEFTTALLAEKDAFLQRAQGVEKLTGNFDAEIQTYMDVLQRAMGDL